MTLVQRLSVLFASGIAMANAVTPTTYTCPTVGSTSTTIIIPTSETIIRIPIVSDTNDLCTLVRHTTTTGLQRAPVARSYAARNWEISAGLFSNAAKSGLAVDCTPADGATGVCDITLPTSPTLELGEEYILESFEHVLSAEATAARFLEQSTFGSTRSDIDSLVAADNNFTAWLSTQMYDIPPSTFRDFYRRRTNPKYENSFVFGAVGSGPCEKFSRWRTYAISSKDILVDRLKWLNKYLTIESASSAFPNLNLTGGYVWKVDGQIRTLTQELPTDMDGFPLMEGFRYAIKHKRSRSWMSDCVGCANIYLWDGGAQYSYIEITNPPVNIAGLESILNIIALPGFKTSDLVSMDDPTEYDPLFATYIKTDENAMLNTTSLDGTTECNALPDFRNPIPYSAEGTLSGVFPTIFGTTMDPNGNEIVMIYDRHLTLYENTVENPLPDGGGQLVIDTIKTEDLQASGEAVKCHNVFRNHIYNEDHCILSTLPTACAPDTKPKEVIALNDANLEGIRDIMDGLALYAVTGLTLSSTYDESTSFNSACATGTTSLNQKQWSRWMKDPNDAVCENIANLGTGTYKIYQDMIQGLQTVGDHNHDVVDVERGYSECDVDDRGKTDLGKVQAHDGSCWRHVHIAEMDVLDLTGADPSLYTISGNTVTFTSTEVFENNIGNFTVIGRFGDHAEIDGSLPFPLDQTVVQDTYKTLEYNPAQQAVLMCGSPEEVASDPFFGNRGFDIILPEGSALRTMSKEELSAQKDTIWTELALHAPDVLRQKMAWSLSQIVSVGLKDGVVADDCEDTEGYLAFYDIFLKNSFGNYKDLMLEFSFSEIMANWLSFEDNRSLQYNIDNGGAENYPDENFAREIMQLFTVGLYKLQMDGSIIINQASGHPEETYTIDDIESYSRAWTGFRGRGERGGAASGGRPFSSTTLDPLYIDIERRDWFPKNNLLKGYIGDKVARCADLPTEHFLRKGAIYRLLGSRGIPELVQDPEEWSENPDFYHLEIESSSPLYAKLCEADGNGACTLPAKVALDANLVYDDAAKTSAEYAVDTIRTVKMKVGSSYIWYEYVRQPCVEHAFYRDGKRVTKDRINGDYVQNKNMCANPVLEAATPMCTEGGWETNFKHGMIFCHYQGERMKFDSAAAICKANGMEQGYAWIIKEWKSGRCGHGINARSFRSWATESCSIQVKIAFESGQIAIVHAPEPDRANITNVENHVSPDTLNFFDTPWESGSYPTMSNCLANAFCSVHSDEYCICSTDTTEIIEYATATEIASINELMSTLHIGSADPTSFDDYNDLGCSIEGVTVYSKPDDGCTSLTVDTVFAFNWKSKLVFLKNVQSKVMIPESSFSFRNPVQFISLSDPEARDAYYETEEVLNSLFYDSSHPPFLAVRLIQRFGLSNPSPDFVKRVSTAYSTGSYGQFRSGEYGDLGAMVAAILLEDESRQVVLDADQTHGHLREPLIKVLSFFKSMGLQFASPLNLPTLIGLEPAIGQGPFESPSVFSFFLPEHSPPGGVQSAGLVAPESMVLQGDNVLHLLDAYWSTTKFGIFNCESMTSFQTSIMNWQYLYAFDCPNPPVEGDITHSPAKLSYSPQSATSSDDIINELDLLLTSGRLRDRNRAIIKSIVDPMMGDVAKATRAAQQLILSSPEYHSTNLPRKQDSARAIAGYTDKPKGSYKAVVVLMMQGGVDSWNLLVPACPSAHAEYVLARGSTHAIAVENLLNISAVGSGQACIEFGVNENFPVLAELYSTGELTFFANTGTLSKPMTKTDNWQNEIGFKLFAHNTMKDSFYTSDIFDANPGTGVFGRILDVLKVQGKQTSANNVDRGGTTMLQGDQMFNNAVHTVSTKSPKDINMYPTVDNLVDVVKSLNGVGEVGNSLNSEHWSSRVASALFEFEQVHDIASYPEFEIPDYPETDVRLTSSFKAIAGYMKSRKYRKVNRDVFFLMQGGYDMHFADELSERFPEANEGLVGFIQEVKNQGLWDSTVIMMGSDFGRSMNTNSNSGTDHAWGGNYFIAGGSVQGGKIMGKFPSPVGPDSDYWLKRGRWLPSTPWESVFNAVAQWMGVHDDTDLDWILPNRESFKSHTLHDMCDLFTDKDLFTDGACQCELVDGVQTTVCDDITYAPTLSPSGSPTDTPTGSPSMTPTADLPDNGFLVPNIFLEGTSATYFGCANVVNEGNAFDGTTAHVWCNRNGFHYTPVGLIISPGQMTIPKALRFYQSSSTCRSCDPISVLLEGRVDSNSLWVEVSSLEIPNNLAMNILDLPIESTYQSGDTNHNFVTTDHFHSQGTAFLEYRVTFEMKVATSGSLQFGEVEVPGMLIPPDPSVSPTAAPTADLPDGVYVNTIFPVGSPVENFGCVDGDRNSKAIDANTGKYLCDRRGFESVENGIIVSPSHSQMSIATKLRIYASNTCSNCDPVSFTLAGRVDSSSVWVDIGSGDFDWPVLPRNEQWLPISSTYDGADETYSHSEVQFQTNNVAYLEYRLTFMPRNAVQWAVQFAEVELPGILIPPDPSVSPTAAPTELPTNKPTLTPSVSPTPAPIVNLPDGVYANTIFPVGSPVENFGCVHGRVNSRAIDATTGKYLCDRRGFESVENGIIVSPSHSQMSIATKLRIYASSHCSYCDPVSFTLAGRVDSSSVWVDIGSGDFDWPVLPRNEQWLPISSTYDGADETYSHTEVQFQTNNVAYLEYRLTFMPRNAVQWAVQFAEVELPGMILPSV